MSLIEEALRRVQEHPPEAPPPPHRPAAPVEPGPAGTPTSASDSPRRIPPVESSAHHAPPPAATPTPRPHSQHSRAWPEGIAIALAGFLAVGWIVWTRWGPIERADRLPTPHPAAPSAAPRHAEAPRRSGPPFGSASPRLSLHGVVEGSGEPLAIINGRIVKVGETVDGATLLEVSRDAARLRWRDQELVLRTTP